MTTASPYADLDLAALDRWSNGVSKHEEVEVFGCRTCKALFVGLPDSHIGFCDPTNPAKTFTYNIPRKVKCPKCGATWYGGVGSKAGYATDNASRAEIE